MVLVLPCPPVANFVPSGWMSTENMGLPVKHKSQHLIIVKSEFTNVTNVQFNVY